MKKFIYLYAIMGLMLISPTKYLLASTNCSSDIYIDEDESYTDSNSDFFTKNNCEQGKSWFTKNKKYYNSRTNAHTETVSLNNSRFTVSGITKSIEIRKDSCFFCSEEEVRPVFINKLLISAQGTSSSDGTMQVVVNGDIKGTIHVPRRDPAYFVTVGEVATSIEFVPVSGTVEVLDIKIIGSMQVPYNYRHQRNYNDHITSTRSRNHNHHYYNQAQDMALRSIDIINELMTYSSYRALGQYLLPIKKSAAQVYAIATSSQYSNKMLKALQHLADHIATARPYTTRVLESSALFDIAMELMSFEEELRSITGHYAKPYNTVNNEGRESLKAYFKSIKKIHKK